MPDTQTVLLWNNTAQGPEAVSLDQVDARIKAGTHQLYENSKVEQEVAPGVTADFNPSEAQFRQKTMGARQALDTAAERSRDLAAQTQKDQYSGTSEAVKEGISSFVETATLGIVDPHEGTDRLSRMEAEIRREEHPIANKVGVVAGIGASLLPSGGTSLLVGGSKIAQAARGAGNAMRLTPLGAAVKAQEAVTQAIRAGRIAKGAKPGLLNAASAEAIGGAVGGGVMAVGQQIGNAINARPVSGDAIVDDMGLGAILGGGLGLAGGAFGRAAQKIKAGGNAKEEILSAARIDEALPEAKGALNEAVGTWKSAHADSSRRLKQLEDMAADGSLDSELSAGDWLGSRREAAKSAKKAQDRLMRVAGTSTIEGAVDRMADLIMHGKARDIEKLSVEFGNYGKAVGALDEAMRPVQLDMDHLLSVNALDDLDSTMAADEHVFNVLGRLIEEGADDFTIRSFARANGLDDVVVADAKAVITDKRLTKANKPKPGDVQAAHQVSDARLNPAKTRLREFDVGDLDTPGVAHVGEKLSPRPGSSKAFDLSDELTSGDDLLFQLQASKRSGKPAGSDLPGPMRRTKEIPNRVREEPVTGTYEQPAGSARTTENLRVDSRKTDIDDVPHGAVAGQLEALEAKAAKAAQKAAEAEQHAAQLLEKAADKASKEAAQLAEKEAARLVREAERAAKEAEKAVTTVREMGGAAGPKLGRTNTSFKAYRVLNESKWSPVPSAPTELSQKIDAVTRKLVDATNGRLGTEEARLLAKQLGLNTARVAEAGPLAEKMADLWALRKLAEATADASTSVGKAARKGRPGLLAKSLRAGASSHVRSMINTPFLRGAAGYAVGGALGAVIGASGALSAIGGRMRTAATLGIAKALNPTGRKLLAFYAMDPTRTSYDGTEPTADFETKAAQLRQLSNSLDAVRQRADDATADIRAIDPAAAASASESTVRRLQNLAARVPAGTYRGPFLPPGPPSPDELDDFHAYEAITHDRQAVFQYIKAGAMPEIVISGMREQHPDFLAEIQQYVIDNPDAVMKAPHQSQVALSQLLGIQLVPEADPYFIQRQQMRYQEAKEKAAQTQMSQQGASMMRGGMPAPVPMTPAQQFAVLPAIR